MYQKGEGEDRNTFFPLMLYWSHHKITCSVHFKSIINHLMRNSAFALPNIEWKHLRVVAALWNFRNITFVWWEKKKTVESCNQGRRHAPQCVQRARTAICCKPFSAVNKGFSVWIMNIKPGQVHQRWIFLPWCLEKQLLLQFPVDCSAVVIFLPLRLGHLAPESRYHRQASVQSDLIITKCFMAGNCIWNEHQSVSWHICCGGVRWRRLRSEIKPGEWVGASDACWPAENQSQWRCSEWASLFLRRDYF